MREVLEGRAGFETACRDFFFKGDRLAGAVLHAIESGDPACPATCDPEQFETALAAATDGWGLAALGDEGRAELRAIRDRIRGQFHAQNTEVQRTELALLLQASSERTALLPGGTPPGGDAQRLEHFVRAHRANVGAHPFLAGLSATLTAQLGQASRIMWTLDDAVLTQAGGLSFAEAAVELLTEGLGFERPPPADLEQQAADGSAREWVVWGALSDAEIGILLGYFPAPSDLFARAAGDREPGGLARREDWGIHRVSGGRLRWWGRNRRLAGGLCGTLPLCVLFWLWRR